MIFLEDLRECLLLSKTQLPQLLVQPMSGSQYSPRHLVPPGAVRIAPQVVSRFCTEDAPAAAVVRVLMVEVPPALRVMMPANHHECAVARKKCKYDIIRKKDGRARTHTWTNRKTDRQTHRKRDTQGRSRALVARET